MSRYIDRDVFLKKIEHFSLSHGTTLGKHSGVADEIIDILMSQTTADVVEVRHGEWINSGFCNSLKNCMLIKCSECDFGHFIKPYLMDYDGVLTFGEFKLNTHYCQNCGAKMDGERKKEE